MRKILISIAAAGSALAFATPAAAQYFPLPQTYAYGYNAQAYNGYTPYGYNAQAYNNPYGYNRYNAQRVHQLNHQIESINRRIQALGRAGRISNGEARSLANEARAVAFRLKETSYNGLSPREERAVQVRLARLEQRIAIEARNGNRWGARYNGWDRNGGWDNGYDRMGPDRDRDGLDDRWEDDHGEDHDD